MRDTGQHHGALLLQFGQFLGHAVKADVHFADFAGHGLFIKLAGGKVTIAHPVGGVTQLLEGPVDQARDDSGTGQGQQPGGAEPNQPRAAAGRDVAGLIQQQPVGVFVDGEAHPQAFLSVDFARQDGVWPQARGQQLFQAQIELGGGEHLKGVTGLPRLNAHAFLIGHGLDQRDTGDGVRVLQRRTAEVDQGGDLLRSLQRAGVKLQCSECLQPRQNAAQQQQCQQEKGAPKKIQAHARACTCVVRGAGGLVAPSKQGRA